MIEELLPYYEKQLQEFGQQSREFAQKYPKIAQRLALNQEQIDDPHIERLIQAFSLIAARIDKKITDSHDIFTRSLFEVMFPQYLRHFPACSVVSFDDPQKLKQLTEPHLIPAQTRLKSRSFRGVQCEFNTTYDVRLLPIQLARVEFKTLDSARAHLSQNASFNFHFDLLNPAQAWLLDEQLPIYLDSISNFPLQVLDQLFKTETQFSITVNRQTHSIPNPFQIMGFEEEQALLPIDQHTHHAYRLLMEYFCFPEKFNYLKLNLSILKSFLSGQSDFELSVHLKLNLNDTASVRNYSELDTENFKLFTTPIINLFEKQAEPQKINHQQLEYSLLTDAHYPDAYQVYAIQNMQMIREKSNQEQITTPVLPFFAMSHYHPQTVKFFYALNQQKISSSSRMQTRFTIVSKQLEPFNTSSDYVSTQLLCSNWDLPHEVLGQTHTTLNLNNSTLARRATVLKRPTMPYQFEQNKNEQWRIISHLSLNTLALMKGDSLSHLKELLALYNLPHSKENILLIHAIKQIQFELTHKLVEAKPFPMFVRGIKANVYLDPAVFRGHSVYIFSQLLSHIFNLKVQMNSFVDVVIWDSQRQQELYQCVQNVGGKALL